MMAHGFETVDKCCNDYVEKAGQYLPRLNFLYLTLYKTKIQRIQF